MVSRREEKLKKQIKKLDLLVPNLKAVTGGKKTGTNIIYYEGEEGLKNWASDALETKDELLEWVRIETFGKPFKKYLETYYFPEKFKKQIPTRFILIDTPEGKEYVQKRYINNPDASPIKARFISREDFDVPAFTIVYNDRFSIALPKELRAVTVVDNLIADSQRKMFEFAWRHATGEMQNKPYPLDN